MHRQGADDQTSRNFAAILLLLLVAVEFGGGSLLTPLTRRVPGYLDNPLPRTCGAPGTPTRACGWCSAWSACYVDQTPLSDGLKSLVRVTLLVVPILVSLGFFLSVLSRRRSGPTGSST
jgi:hypothetical protein